MPNATIFKLVRGDRTGHLSKTIEADGEGGITKSGGGLLVSGKLTTRSVTTLVELDALLLSLKSKQAVAWGVPIEERATRVASREAVERVEDTTGDVVISRTRDAFKWPDGIGVLMLDYDPAPGEAALGMRRLVTRLRKAAPGLANVQLLHRPSGSSLIYDSDGSELSGLSGQRLYMLVEDASDIPRAGEALADRLWLAGEGRIEVSKAGSALKRTLVDTAVWQPERLDFAGGAHLEGGLTQRREPGTILGDGSEVVDSVAVIPDLTGAERVQVEKLKARAQRKAQPELEKVFESWVAAQVKEGVPEWQAREAHKGATLHGDFRIMVYVDGWQPEVVTVDQLLSEPERWHGETCRDPLEPDYRGGAQVGKLFTDQDTPKLYSQAHGGVTYLLEVGEPRSREDDWAFLAEAMGIEVEECEEVEDDEVEESREWPGYVILAGQDRCVTPTGRILTKKAFNDTFARSASYPGQIDVDKKGRGTKRYEKHAWDAALHSWDAHYLVDRADLPGFRIDLPPARRWVEGDLTYVNIYRPHIFSVSDDEARVEPVLKHLKAMFPYGDDFDILLDWLAYPMQTGAKMGWAPVLQSTHGAGKNIIQHILRYVWGCNFRTPRPRDVFSDYNGWLEGAMCIFVNEIKVGHAKRDLVELLKEPITETTHSIRRMRTDPYDGPTPGNFVFCTNHKDAMPMDRGERRFAHMFSAFQTAEQLIAAGYDAEYFTWLYGEVLGVGENGNVIDEEGLAAFAGYLMRRACVHKAGKAPYTASRDEAVALGRSIMADILAELVETEAYGFRNGWANTKLFIEAAGGNHKHSSWVAAAMQELGYVRIGRAGKSEHQAYLYHIDPAMVTLTGVALTERYQKDQIETEAEAADAAAREKIAHMADYRKE